MWSSIIHDWILASQEAISELQWWLGLLEAWQQAGGVSQEEFEAAYQQLQDAGLIGWAAIAAGHGIVSLAAAVATANGCDEGDAYAWAEFLMADEVTTQREAFPSAIWQR